MDFQSINTFDDIKDLMDKVSSDDGEGLNFELKGSQGESQINRDHKKLLAKEICAFANTYGGVLCFHFGGDTKIEEFPTRAAYSSFNSLEGWLRDSLEPKLLGMDLKIVDNVFLINIPESKTKPHRTASTAEYYFRHSTISQKMPEIMISSMYRSQDYLSYSTMVSVFKTGKQLSIDVYIENHSNLSGTKPKIQIQLYSGLGKQIQFQENHYYETFSKDSFQSSSRIQTLKIPKSGMLETNSIFSEKILYPQDRITLANYSLPDDDILNLKYIMIRIDCMFKEANRQTVYSIVEISEQNKSKIHMSTKDENEEAVLLEFKRLLVANDNEV